MIKAATPSRPNENRIIRLENDFMNDLEKSLNKQLDWLLEGINETNLSSLLRKAKQDEFSAELLDTITKNLLKIARAGAEEAPAIKAEAAGIDWTLVNKEVQKWVEKYAFDLVTGITETTAADLRQAIIAFSESRDMSINQLRDILANTFGVERARMIAVTETTRSYAEGNMQSWKEAGIATGKRWNTGMDELVCPICAPLNQTIADIGGTFANGGEAPPAHPNCRCFLTPYVSLD